MNKKGLISGFVMLALLLSVFAIPFGAMAGWDDPSSDLNFRVTDGTDRLKDVDYSVVSALSGVVKGSGTTDSSGKGSVSDLDHDNYILKLEKDGFQYRNVVIEYYDGAFRYDGSRTIAVGMSAYEPPVDFNIQVDGLEENTEVRVLAYNHSADGKSGVKVSGSNNSAATTSTNVTLALQGDMDYTIEVTAYHDNVRYVKEVITHSMPATDDNITVTMQTGKKLNGLVGDIGDVGFFNVVFYKDDGALFGEEAITRAETSDDGFSAVLSDGEYYVSIVIEGYKGIMGWLEITGGSVTDWSDELHYSEDSGLLIIEMEAKEKQRVNTEFKFNEDFSAFDYKVTMDLDFGFSVGGMDYSELPLRMQIDTLFGDGDGNVSAQEATEFLELLVEHWLKDSFPPITDNLLAIEGVTYESDRNLSIEHTGIDGNVNSSDGFTLVLRDNYSALDEIDAIDYEVGSKMSYDTVEFDYSYTFSFPENYEIDRFKELESAFLSIERDDAGVFTFDPKKHDSSTLTKIFEITTSAKPSAVGSITPSDFAYAVEEDGVLQHYIVGEGKEVEFDASESADANGNPLMDYVWDFGDGNSSSGETVKHTYETGGEYTVTLTVYNHYGENSSIEFTVMVDGIAPQPEIGVATERPKVGTAVSFTGHNSTDDLLAAGDGLGVIAKWSWDFGDGNSVNKTTDGGNVTHTYDASGDYTVTLTVYDAAGNSDTATEDVTVIRAEAPAFSVDLPDEMPLFTEGSASEFEVTVKNTGDWDAQNVMVNLYIRDGNDWRLVSASEVELGDLAKGEEETVIMSWTPNDAGSFRLKVEASTIYEGTDITGENYRTVEVDEAAWRTIAIVAAVIGVIILVIVLVYFRNRLPGSKRLDLKGGKDYMAPAKIERPLDDFDDFEEPRKKSQSQRPPSSKGGKRRR